MAFPLATGPSDGVSQSPVQADTPPAATEADLSPASEAKIVQLVPANNSSSASSASSARDDDPEPPEPPKPQQGKRPSLKRVK